MKKFLIEREIPGAAKIGPDELKAISKTSLAVIAVFAKPYRWIESYVLNDKVYCVHEAENEAAIREHSSCANLPISSIEEIKSVISPATAL